MEKSIGNFTYSQSNYLGRGSYSTVYEGRNDLTQQVVAVKIIEKKLMQSQLNAELIIGEIETMKTLKHPNLVQMLEVYQTQNNFYLILDLCNQGDLECLIKKGPLDEQYAIQIISQIVKGYEYLYNNGIMHRDLKPSNIFLHNNQVKIADFGFALKTNQGQQVKTRLAGTPAYASPQMLRNQFYSYQNDMWSLGVLIYEMLHGQNPWPQALNQQHLLQLMMGGNVQIKQSLSQMAKDLINSLLKFEESDRLTFNQLKSHPIFNQRKSSSEQIQSSIQDTDSFQLKQMKILKYLQQSLQSLEYDPQNIVLQYIMYKLILIDNKKYKLAEFQDFIAFIKKQFLNLVQDLENQQFLSEILLTSNQNCQDFGLKFIKFAVKQILQALRKLNHKLSSKPQQDDQKMIEFILKNQDNNVKPIYKIDQISLAKIENPQQYYEFRNKIINILE